MPCAASTTYRSPSRRGEIVAVTGPSGSGKSTLLYLLGGLDDPDAGPVRVAGIDWRSLRGRARARFRRRTCGFIAQGLALLPQATAAENVEVPAAARRCRAAASGTGRVGAALERVGLADARARSCPTSSPAGQQQRVAIARALIAEPAVVLADEPTGEPRLRHTPRPSPGCWSAPPGSAGRAVVLVTHDPDVAAVRRPRRDAALRAPRRRRPAGAPEVPR